MKKLQLNVMLLADSANFSESETFIKDYRAEKEVQFDKGDIEAVLYHKEGNIKHSPWVKNFMKKNRWHRPYNNNS